MANYQQPDHAGLQATPSWEDAPEVVAGTQAWAPAGRRSSIGSPESFLPYAQTNKGAHGHFGQLSPSAHSEGHYGTPPSNETKHETKGAEAPRHRTVCGLKRKVFFILLAVAIVIILAAVLGGVLGTHLKKSPAPQATASSNDNATSSNSSTVTPTPINVFQGGGLSLIVPAASSDELPALYSYYQAGDGTLVENAYNSSIMQATSNMTVAVAGAAANGTPIAATSWISNSHTTRQVFYIDASGRVMTTNTTGIQAWSTPYNVLNDDSAKPNTNALAVCSGTALVNTGLDGIRVYYGSSSCSYPNSSATGCIREVGMDFFESTQPIWHMWASFPFSDVNSGVACAVSDNVNHLYFRNSTGTGVLQQWQWSYVDQYGGEPVSWIMDASGPSNMTSGSDIAVANDGSNTDHIFYQSAGGQLERALYYGSSITDLVSLDVAADGTKLATSYANGSAILMYQGPLNTSLYYQIVTRNGQHGVNGLVG